METPVDDEMSDIEKSANREMTDEEIEAARIKERGDRLVAHKKLFDSYWAPYFEELRTHVAKRWPGATMEMVVALESMTVQQFLYNHMRMLGDKQHWLIDFQMEQIRRAEEEAKKEKVWRPEGS